MQRITKEERKLPLFTNKLKMLSTYSLRIHRKLELIEEALKKRLQDQGCWARHEPTGHAHSCAPITTTRELSWQKKAT